MLKKFGLQSMAEELSPIKCYVRRNMGVFTMHRDNYTKSSHETQENLGNINIEMYSCEQHN